MGIRVFDDISMIPARLRDGTVEFEIGNEVYGFYVEALKGRSAPLQCNFNKYLYCKALLFSDTEAYLLRDDGTGTIYRIKDLAIKEHFKYKAVYSINRTTCINGGYLQSVDNIFTELSQMDLIFVGEDGAILSSNVGCMVMPFSVGNEQGYLRVLEKAQPDVPRLAIHGRILSIVSKGEEVYSFNTKLIRANSYGTYGGRQILCE